MLLLPCFGRSSPDITSVSDRRDGGIIRDGVDVGFFRSRTGRAASYPQNVPVGAVGCLFGRFLVVGYRAHTLSEFAKLLSERDVPVGVIFKYKGR